MDDLDRLRRQAKQLHKSFDMGDRAARDRVRAASPRGDGEALKRADFLHVIARENNFSSWPQLKFAVEAQGMDRAAKVQRLKIALAHGQTWVVEHLLDETPDLAEGHFGLQVALLDWPAVQAALAGDPGLAVRAAGPRRPILHLAFSRAIHIWPERRDAMLQIAQALVDHGADVNDGTAASAGDDHVLSALYGAIGHADNMVLGQWLLDHGANPNDDESLYHATELGHREGLRMLLAAGANPNGTNALQRAMDFDDLEAVRMLLEAGADPNGFNAAPTGGEPPWTVPTLHQAARRQVSDGLARLLLDHGADPAQRWRGVLPYAYARVHGHVTLADMIATAGGPTEMSETEVLLAAAAEGRAPAQRYVDPNALALPYRDILREILHLPRKLPHLKALVAVGVEYDRPDGMGVTPVQVAGWEGLPEIMAYFLHLKPDLSHVNAYGGTLLSTIIHGSENAPDRAVRDHIGCARLALEEGVALPKRAIALAGAPEMAAFLADWAEAHPGQVVEGGLA